MREIFAYAFESDLTPGQVLERLNQAGPWEWIERDNDAWGFYISAVPFADPPHDVFVKMLFETRKRYVVNARFESEAPDAEAMADQLRQTVVGRLLPAIGARNVEPTEDYER